MIKILLPLIGFLAWPLQCLGAAVPDVPAWRDLFDGRTLSGWTTYLAKPHSSVQLSGVPRDAKGAFAAPLGVNCDPTGVFTVVQVDGVGAIRISGEIFGSLTTAEEFGNYRLRLEIRWGTRKWEPRLEARRDSGLLYHAHGLPGSQGAWMNSVELQIQEHDCGDLWSVGTLATALSIAGGKDERTYDPKGAPFVFGRPKEPRRCIRLADHERPWGEWNVIELVCFGDRSWHIVNGQVVLELQDLRRLDKGKTPRSLSAGKIQLQSEGAELFVRKVQVHSLSELPEELARLSQENRADAGE